MRTILRVLVFFSPVLLVGQSTKLSPDCDIPFTLTGAGQSSSTGGCAQNLQGVVTWEMTYQSDGFSGLSILVQQAADSNGSPGSWMTFTAATGSNPNTSTTGLNAQSGYTGQSPWVRVTLSSATGSGTIVGHLYGWRTGSGGGSGGGGGSGCAGTVATPCLIGTDVGGTNTPQPGDANGRLQLGTGNASNTVSLSSSGLTQIIAASSGNTTTIQHLSVLMASGVTFQLEYGTGTNCGTGTTAITGTYPSNFTGATWDPGDLPIVPSGNAVCINLGSSVTGGGIVTFSQP